MLQKNKQFIIKKSKFVESYMILYTAVNIVKLIESGVDDDNDVLTQELLSLTLEELFRTALVLDNGLWN